MFCSASKKLSSSYTKLNGCFCDDCVEYVNLMQKYFEIVQLTIVSLWPDLKELALLKSKLKIDLIVQIPLYKIKHIDSAEIRQRILSYVDIATAFIFDTSGGNGIEHDVEKTLEIILPFIKVFSDKTCIAGGLNKNNVFSVTQKVLGKLNIVEPELRFKTIKHLYDLFTFVTTFRRCSCIIFQLPFLTATRRSIEESWIIL